VLSVVLVTTVRPIVRHRRSLLTTCVTGMSFWMCLNIA
jgi:hypothetical protein